MSRNFNLNKLIFININKIILILTIYRMMCNSGPSAQVKAVRISEN